MTTSRHLTRATQELPCNKYGHCSQDGSWHNAGCPAFYRPAIAAALEEAGAGEIDPRETEMNVGTIKTALAFFPSVIKCGESWSRTCDDILCSAKLALEHLSSLRPTSGEG